LSFVSAAGTLASTASPVRFAIGRFRCLRWAVSFRFRCRRALTYTVFRRFIFHEFVYHIGNTRPLRSLLFLNGRLIYFDELLLLIISMHFRGAAIDMPLYRYYFSITLRILMPSRGRLLPVLG
jgi:hypothetical protein